MFSFLCQLSRLQYPITQSNTVFHGIALKYSVDVIKVHNELTLSKGDYLR